MYRRVDSRKWWILALNCLISISAYHVTLEDNGPIVKGGNISFLATLYDGHNLASGTFKYSWMDTAVPIHSVEHESQSPHDSWCIAYNNTVYPAGRYVAQVVVYKIYYIYPYEIASNRVEFFINETLNGEILLMQNNKTRSNSFVSNAETVIHNISLKATDADWIKRAPTVLTYWFVDCTYYGFRKDFIFPFNYTEADKEHFVEALVVADFTPLPPPPTTTTTTTTPSTTITTPSTTTTGKPTTTTSTTSKPTTVSTPTTHKPLNEFKSVVKRDSSFSTNMNTTSNIMVNVNGTLQPYNGVFPFVCNSSQVVMDPKKTYGYFTQRIKVKAPVAKVNITGNNWLQHGDLLSLNVKCHGSSNLKYCVQYQKGVFNVTGKENCSSPPHELEKCEFPIQRYFMKSIEYTIVIIIENEVSKVVTPVAVTVYKVKKQPQLSVIVVPVAFSIVAVVLIVFGVAYYLQNRSRFVVEVADFNFGQNYSDMEYKTFKERLRDSIANAFFSRALSTSSSEVPVWPPGRKYGSMTT